MQPSCFVIRHHVLAAALSSALLSAPVRADDAADLDRVVVTATRTAQTQDETLAAVTVIERADIERLQPASLPDLLRGTPGLSLSNNGGAGKATSIFLRGTESDHVLVLVDGIKIGSATSGGAAIQDIPVDQIERIEIVRGPFSSLYGSEALGGVIQIFTRRPSGPLVPNFSAGYGSYDSYRASAGIAGRGERAWYSVQGAHQQTDGINACRGRPSPGGAGCFTFEPDHDGYRNNSLSAQGGVSWGSDWEAEARLLHAEGRNEFDGSFTNESDTVQQVVGARLRYSPSERLSVTANGARSADLSDNFKDGRFSSEFDSRREQASVQGDIGLGTGLLSVGLDWQRDKVESSTAYDDTRRNNRAAFGQWQQQLGAHGVQLSLRRDDDDQFGGETTGSALWGVDFSPALRLTASYGTAYKAPSFNELYFPGFGNPNLEPESSRSAELGLRGQQGWGGWTVNAFDTQVDDLIAFDADIFAPNNIDRASIQGVEATAQTALAGFDVAVSATWLDPRNDGDSFNHGNTLPRRARHSGRVDVDRNFGRFNLGTSVYAAGRRYDDLANNRELPGYATTDLRFGYRLAEAWSVQLAANNLFNRRYETAAFYQQPGFNYFLSLRYQPAR